MFKIKKITGRYNKKTGVSFITHSVLNMGREFQTEEEYQKWVKQSFMKEHDIELGSGEIFDIQFGEFNTIQEYQELVNKRRWMMSELKQYYNPDKYNKGWDCNNINVVNFIVNYRIYDSCKLLTLYNYRNLILIFLI